MTDTPIPTPVVYLGTVTLEGNKPGERWTTEIRALAAKTVEDLLAGSSPFGKRRTGYTIGAVYDSGAAQVDAAGQLTTLGRDLTYRRMVQTDAMAALVLREKAAQAREDAKRAEAKARKAGPADDLLDQVARIVAAAPFQQQASVAQGFAVEVQRRALDIWRKGRSR